MSFFEKLSGAIVRNQSLLVVSLDPNPEMLPPDQNWGSDRGRMLTELGNLLETMISQTSHLVCAYKPTFGLYNSLGVEGMKLLARVLAAIPDHIPIILDAKHGDLNSSSIFAQTVFEDWSCDAITLNPYPGQDQAAPFLVYPNKAVFILCRTSNPGASGIQDYPNTNIPLYLQVVKEARNWGTPEQLALEVGTHTHQILANIRSIAPERLILARSIWAEGEDKLKDFLNAGLDINGEGLLIPVPQDWFTVENFGERLNQKIIKLNKEINEIRFQKQEAKRSCDLWIADVCFLEPHPHQDLILQLYDIGCILFGEYVQASGATFAYYIDLRKVISNPQIFHQVLKTYEEILEQLEFDRIAGIPYGSLPTATGLSLRLHHPMIFPRKEVKAHGTRRLIEGHFEPGEKVVVVDDILISGKSVIEGAEKLKSVGLLVEDLVVFIDHEKGVKERVREQGYRPHSVLSISDITRTLYQAGRLNEEQYQVLVHSQS